MEATDAMVARVRDEAERVWCPELARLIRETAAPFVNDADPLLGRHPRGPRLRRRGAGNSIKKKREEEENERSKDIILQSFFFLNRRQPIRDVVCPNFIKNILK